MHVLLLDWFAQFELFTWFTQFTQFANFSWFEIFLICFILLNIFLGLKGRFHSVFWDFRHYLTMILQRIRILVGDVGFEPGTSAPERVGWACYLTWFSSSPESLAGGDPIPASQESILFSILWRRPYWTMYIVQYTTADF